MSAAQAGRAEHDAPSLRDDAWLVATVVGAAAIAFLPAGLLVVGPTREFLVFALLSPAGWLVTATVQVAVLRACRSRRFGGPASVAVQCGWAIAVVVASQLLLLPWTDAAAARAGLVGDDAWPGSVVGAWLLVPLALFMVWQREGRHRHVLASRRLHAVQQEQLTARRRLTQSQLQAVQARVDPQLFFETLDAIEALHQHRDVARAEALFDELIVFLRAALPSIDTASSTLARELALAASAVRLQALASGDDLALAVDCAVPLQRLAFPPGVLLPLLRASLAAGHGRRRLAIGVALGDDAGRGLLLVLTLTAADAPAAPDPAALQRVRGMLQALFADSASLDCSAVGDGRFTTTLSIDHDCC